MRDLSDSLRSLHRAKGVGQGTIPASEVGGIEPFSVDLSVAGPTPNSLAGFGFYFPEAGNPAGAILDIDFGGGSRLYNAVPGDLVRLPFNQFTVRRATGSVATGIARLYVSSQPDANYQNVAGSGAAGVYGDVATVGPAGTVTQAANSTGNTPSAAGDGVSLQGVEGLRVLVSAELNQTLSAVTTGEVRWWLYWANVARWALSEEGWTPSRSGVRDITSPDFAVLVKSGADRAYPEVRSWPTSAGDLVVKVARYGRLV